MVAGEASGDLHAARLLSALRRRVPDLEAFGLGGDELRAAGLETLADSAEISVVGIVEVAKIYRRAKQIFNMLLQAADERQVEAAVLVDFPDFNLRLAKQLHRRGIRVIYYISPQVWAWRRGRVKAIARDVEEMLVLFPFEVDFYRQHGVDARHVGHPLVDEVPVLDQAWQRGAPAGTDDEILTGGEPTSLALLPGSRPSEVRSLLPNMLGAARRIAAARPTRCRLIQAPTIPSSLVDEIVAATPEAADLELERVRSERFRVVADAHLALCASGTATVETALLGTPMLVLYRLKTTSYLLAKWLVDLPSFSMVNLVLGHARGEALDSEFRSHVVPELLQDATEPEHVARLALELLDDPARVDAMRGELAKLRLALGERGASERAALAVVERFGWAAAESAL